MEIRTAVLEDAEELRNLYAPYVTDTAITFEYEIPEVEEFSRRIEQTLKKYPYLVAVQDGAIIGYAYAGAFRTRAAYQHSAELSIYVDPAFHGAGIGRRLYLELENILRRQHVYVLYACITATSRQQDPNLNDGSIRFHEKMGYTLAGSFHQCGYKFGRWYDMIWMEKEIEKRPADPKPLVPFPAL